MKKAKAALTFLSLCCLTLAQAQVKNVAVVETELDAQSGAAAKMTKAEVRQITVELRSVAVKTLPRDKYNVMTSETVYAQGSATLVECAEENCVIALGSKIGADYIVRGIISKFGTSLTLSVEMYETTDGNLVASSGLVRSEKTAALLDKTAAICADMYKAFVTERHPELAVQSSYAGGARLTFKDARDGKVYAAVKIGALTWMAQNLNYKPQTGNSWCYDSDNLNCNRYGRLYDWNTAKIACPAGWHLASRAEWDELMRAVGSEKERYANGKETRFDYWRGAGEKLKSTSGWNKNDNGSDGNGTDNYGFLALPGGGRYHSNGNFHEAGNRSIWWTATEYPGGFGIGFAYHRMMDSYANYVIEDVNDKSDGFSVRCVRD